MSSAVRLTSKIAVGVSIALSEGSGYEVVYESISKLRVHSHFSTMLAEQVTLRLPLSRFDSISSVAIPEQSNDLLHPSQGHDSEAGWLRGMREGCSYYASSSCYNTEATRECLCKRPWRGGWWVRHERWRTKNILRSSCQGWLH
jgi:hypothetical protein